jgi:hypothetical protein
MLIKVNVQFASGSKRFMFGDDSGAERANMLAEEISRHNFAYARGAASGYCAYCPIREICREEAVVR